MEIAQEVGCSVEAVLKSTTGVYSIDTLIPSNEDGNPWDLLLASTGKRTQQSHFKDIEEKEFVEFLLSHLSEEEKFIIQSRVGTLPKLSLKELGEIFDLSKERIRQIENRTYDKLRKAIILHTSEKEAGNLLKLIVQTELGIKNNEIKKPCDEKSTN